MRTVTKSKGAFNIFCFLLIGLTFFFVQCKKPANSPQPPPPPPASLTFDVVTRSVNSISFNSTQSLYGINNNPLIQIFFSDKIDKNSVSSAVAYYNKSQSSATVSFNVSYQNGDSSLLISPSAGISYLNEYIFSVSTLLKSASGKTLAGRVDLDFFTSYDPSSKFPAISDDSLLTLVQKQTFKYFWEFQVLE